MSRKKKEKEQPEVEKEEAPITRGKVSAENPSGIEAVSDKHAEHFGQRQDTGGPGAAGATVSGAIGHVATEGGTKPLPVPNMPEGVETEGGADASDQPTSQAAAQQASIDAEASEEKPADDAANEAPEAE